MKEKLKEFLNSHKLKELSQKIFTKKKIRAVIAAIVLIAVLKTGYSLAFEVKGTVLKIENNSIVVTNFLGTRTVDLGDYPLDSSNVVAGQRIEITKNISGDVIAVKGIGGKQGRGNGGFKGQLPGRGTQAPNGQQGKGNRSIKGGDVQSGTSDKSGTNQAPSNGQTSGTVTQ